MPLSELLTPYEISFLTSFAVCSYATALVLISQKAKRFGMLDLCDVIRRFTFAPFVVIAGMFLGTAIFFLCVLFVLAIIKYIWLVISIIIGAILIGILFYFVGTYVLAPAVKKSYGVVKPFTSKLCVVLWKRK